MSKLVEKVLVPARAAAETSRIRGGQKAKTSNESDEGPEKRQRPRVGGRGGRARTPMRTGL